MNEREFWTRETLNGVSKALLSGIVEVLKETKNNQPPPHPPFFEAWRMFYEKFNFKPGTPDSFVKKAYYADEVVADYYDFEEVPVYYERKGTVVVKNPFFALGSSEPCLSYTFVEMDAELAKKILVLGLPPL